MGHETIVYGKISAMVTQAPRGEALFKLNETQLNKLPVEDNYPWITKWMFSTIPVGTQGIYRNQIIHFGASYKQLESDWHIWIEKFEAILKQLHWFSATLHLETELVGDYEYSWIADINEWEIDRLEPTTKWSFEGGPRDFRTLLKSRT